VYFKILMCMPLNLDLFLGRGTLKCEKLRETFHTGEGR